MIQDLTSLVAKAQKGDKDAMNDLIAQSYDELYYFAYKTVKNEDLAADITQESCITILQKLNTLTQPGAFKSWARQVVYHHCTHHFRDTHEVQATENEDGETIFDTLADTDTSVMPEAIAEDKAFQKIMQDLLNELPAEQRAALMLYYYEKMSVSEIASIQGVSEGTIKSRLNYGRKAVKAKVEEYEKKNDVRLHSSAILPALLYFLFQLGKEETAKAGMALAPGVAAGVGTATVGIGVKIAVATGLVLSFGAIGGVIGSHMINPGPPPTNPTIIATPTTGVSTPTFSTIPSSGTTTAPTTQPTSDPITQPTTTVPTTKPTTVTTTMPIVQANPVSDFEYTISDKSGYVVIQDYVGSSKDVVIPATINGFPVRYIGIRAFTGTVAENVVLPDTLEEIMLEAFLSCKSLKTIHFPSNLQKIGFDAFRNCSSLEQVNFPDGLESIKGGAFSGCIALKEVVIPGTVKDLGEELFSGCDSIETVTFKHGLEVIGGRVMFTSPMIKTLEIPSSVKEIKSEALLSLKLDSITFLGDAPIVGKYHFQWCPEHFTIYYDPNTSGWDDTPLSEYNLVPLFQPENVPEAFWNVLNNKQEIQFADRSIFIDDYSFLEHFDDIKDCSNVRYTVITTDAGETMLLIEHEESILVLFEDAGVVYGRSYNFRNMYHICTNGVYTWNDTDAEGHHYGQDVLCFKDGKITSRRLWQIDNDGSENAKYMIGEDEVTRDALLAYSDSIDEEYVSWSDLTRYPIPDLHPGG